MGENDTIEQWQEAGWHYLWREAPNAGGQKKLLMAKRDPFVYEEGRPVSEPGIVYFTYAPTKEKAMADIRKSISEGFSWD